MMLMYVQWFMEALTVHASVVYCFTFLTYPLPGSSAGHIGEVS